MRTLEERVMADARSPDNSCIRCGSTGTTCGRHYNGPRQHLYGKGRGIKGHPVVVADFCKECDALFQEGCVPKAEFEKRLIYSEEFQHYCILSLMRRIWKGVIQ